MPPVHIQSGTPGVNKLIEGNINMGLVVFQEPQPSTFCKVFSAWESVTYNFGLFSKYLSSSSFGADSFRSLEFIAIMAGRQVLRQVSRVPPFSSTNIRLACVCVSFVCGGMERRRRGGIYLKPQSPTPVAYLFQQGRIF